MNLIFFIGLFFSFLLPPFDPDLGWQIRCGQLIASGQGFCRQNQFSVLLPDYSWTNHHWLYQVITFFLWQNFGLWGTTIFNASLVTFICLLFHQTIKNYSLEKKWAIILVLYLSWGVFSWGIRSQLLGLLYFVLIIFLLLQEKIKLLPLIFLFWTNTHGSVIFGLGFLYLFSLKNVLALNKKVVFSIILSTLAVFINPFGFRIFQVAWQHLHGFPLEKLIAEWVPPQSFQWLLILSLGLFLLFFSSKTLSPSIIAITYLALKARRHLPFFFIFFFILFFNNSLFKKWLQFWLKKKTLRKNLFFLTSFSLFFYGFFYQLPQTLKINSSWSSYCQASIVNYPCSAVDFLKNQPEKGPLFNRYEWGGFLIWQLPEYKVFVDGRMPAWPTPSGKSPYTIYLETLQTQPGWQETLDDYQINWILISPGTFMDLKLQPAPESFGWSEVYRDKISVIYKKM